MKKVQPFPQNEESNSSDIVNQTKRNIGTLEPGFYPTIFLTHSLDMIAFYVLPLIYICFIIIYFVVYSYYF